MGRSDRTSSYDTYLQLLGDEISDLDPARREEILMEVSAHLEDADEDLSDSLTDPRLRANRVLSQPGPARTLARQLGEVHTGPTGLIQRVLAPCLLVALTAGHVATAVALRTAYTAERAMQTGLFDVVYTHLYLVLAGLAFLLAVRQLFLILRHPFKATNFQIFVSLFPLALLLAMVLAGFSDEGQPVAYRVKQFWYSGFFGPHLYATGTSLLNEEPKFFESGLALAALSVLGILPALLLRQPRWLLLWAAIHGTLLTVGLLLPLMLGALLVWPQNAGLLPVLMLPWLYASAAWLLGLPLRKLGRKPFVIWAMGALAGAGLLLEGYFFPSFSMTGLLAIVWYWPATISLPVCARRLWPYAEPERRVNDPLAALLLVPATLVLSLMVVQTNWATPESWQSRIAMWDNGDLLWGAAQWLFVAALAVWALLLAAILFGRVTRRRPRLLRS